MIGVGDTAPNFMLKDQNNEEVDLASFRGVKAVLLVFYPLAFTGTCTGELQALRDNLGVYQNDEVQVLTISVDSTYTHKVFADREGFDFPLLADFWPHGGVAQSYGAFHEAAGIANRATFLLDKGGTVVFAESNGPGQGRDPAVWEAAIRAL